MKIKIRELINKIINYEDVPYEVKYNDDLYKWCRDIGDYRKDGYGECLIIKSIFGTFDCCTIHNSLYNMLFDEVEIIEENKEENEIEKIDYRFDIDGDAYIPTNKQNYFIDGSEVIVVDKINEIIDYIESKEKGE